MEYWNYIVISSKYLEAVEMNGFTFHRHIRCEKH